MMHPIEIISVFFFVVLIFYSIIDIAYFVSWKNLLKKYNWDYKELQLHYDSIYVGLTTRLMCKYKLYQKNKIQKQLYVDQFKLIKSIEAIKKEYKIE